VPASLTLALIKARVDMFLNRQLLAGDLQELKHSYTSTLSPVLTRGSRPHTLNRVRWAVRAWGSEEPRGAEIGAVNEGKEVLLEVMESVSLTDLTLQVLYPIDMLIL